MQTTETHPPQSKFQRYRAKKRAAGYKEVRFWVKDTSTPEFRREAKRQGLALRGRAEELEATAFAEAVLAEIPPETW